ncbi:hypothetical protein BKA65DRAFT_11063 [Rhexocercosporidium sp. MPI-PUGE-AT-0058]|nr:hypothetical protein BKA65DRAFT_11063 [Rhexocercosporidium sp. MPI-PUGE-AT-0058]
MCVVFSALLVCFLPLRSVQIRSACSLLICICCDPSARCSGHGRQGTQSRAWMYCSVLSVVCREERGEKTGEGRLIDGRLSEERQTDREPDRDRERETPA